MTVIDLFELQTNNKSPPYISNGKHLLQDVKNAM